MFLLKHFIELILFLLKLKVEHALIPTLLKSLGHSETSVCNCRCGLVPTCFDFPEIKSKNAFNDFPKTHEHISNNFSKRLNKSPHTGKECAEFSEFFPTINHCRSDGSD